MSLTIPTARVSHHIVTIETIHISVWFEPALEFPFKSNDAPYKR